MKTKNIFAVALAVLALSSCSKENLSEDPDSGGSISPDKAYMAISLTGSKNLSDPMNTSRAGGDPGVQQGEDDLNDVHLLYFDENNLFLGISNKLTASDFDVTVNAYHTRSVVEVPGATKKVFVIVNNYKSNGTDTRFMLPGKSEIGHPWSAINQTLTASLTNADGVNEFIAGFTGQQGSKNNFAMVNFGVRFTNGTDYNTADNGLVGVETGKDATEAKTKNNTVIVDRIASKVEFKIVEITPSTGEIAALPVNAKFFFQGWEMNTTNRMIRLYSEHDSDYKGANANNALVAYRKDANYTVASYGSSSSWDEYKKQFVYLQNVATDGTGTTSAVAKAANTSAYCPENTMQAAAQVIGGTTKVTLKGNYVPDGFAANDSYFLYAGIYYTLSQIQTVYKTAYDANQTGGIVKDMNDFMKAAGLASTSDNAGAIATKVAGLTAASFNSNTGIRARLSNAVRYFHQGVSYYDILVRHDSRITATMALAKYGVVRNNWYTLTLNSVSRPGTPWIPGGPDDPITPPNTPDDNVAMLDVTISINPWITWSQLINL